MLCFLRLWWRLRSFDWLGNWRACFEECSSSKGEDQEDCDEDDILWLKRKFFDKRRLLDAFGLGLWLRFLWFYWSCFFLTNPWIFCAWRIRYCYFFLIQIFLSLRDKPLLLRYKLSFGLFFLLFWRLHARRFRSDFLLDLDFLWLFLLATEILVLFGGFLLSISLWRKLIEVMMRTYILLFLKIQLLPLFFDTLMRNRCKISLRLWFRVFDVSDQSLNAISTLLDIELHICCPIIIEVDS